MVNVPLITNKNVTNCTLSEYPTFLVSSYLHEFQANLLIDIVSKGNSFSYLNISLKIERVVWLMPKAGDLPSLSLRTAIRVPRTSSTWRLRGSTTSNASTN